MNLHGTGVHNLCEGAISVFVCVCVYVGCIKQKHAFAVHRVKCGSAWN